MITSKDILKQAHVTLVHAATLTDAAILALDEVTTKELSENSAILQAIGALLPAQQALTATLNKLSVLRDALARVKALEAQPEATILQDRQAV
jgi:hypothetical protein